MINLNTNLSSLITQRSLATSTQRLNQAIEQMTTGFKINHAKDNAANYNITTNMTTKIGAYMVAEDNCAMGLDLLATANGSLDQIADKLQRLRALAVQTSNGTYGEQSKQAINQEANAIVDEIERIYNTTEYNGINLMKGQVAGVEESKFIKDIDRRDTSRMTTLASVDPDKALTSGTYSISTPEELAKLATMTNNGLIGAACEFVLGADIDLSGYSAGEGWIPIGTYDGTDNNHIDAFVASFDGNGYKISNLKINVSNKNYIGLFGYVMGATIENIALENANVTNATGQETGTLIGHVTTDLQQRQIRTKVKNCYATGKVSGSVRTGGFIGLFAHSEMEDCYSEVEVWGEKYYIGGFTGYATNFSAKNCFSDGDVTVTNGNISWHPFGTFSGSLATLSNLTNCYARGSMIVNGNSSTSFAYKESNFSADSTITNCYTSGDGSGLDYTINNSNKITNRNSSADLQVGINSENSSKLNIDFVGGIGRLDLYRSIGLNEEDNLIAGLDSILMELSKKQTTFGAIENRLNSALEEISVQYENLVSSRSTLRDADISEVSSEYIRQQILQQASATLMATANQSPSIALQLI